MRTDDFVQDYSDGIITVEREIRVMHLRLTQARWMLAYHHRQQERDRHFLGLAECEHVIAAADKVEDIERRIRELERRKRVQDDQQRRAA